MTQRKQRPKASDRGRYKLAVYFKHHHSHDGSAYYFWSNASQDKANTSVNRFKKLISTKWTGKVNWAGIYENGTLIHEYSEEKGGWHTST